MRFSLNPHVFLFFIFNPKNRNTNPAGSIKPPPASSYFQRKTGLKMLCIPPATRGVFPCTPLPLRGSDLPVFLRHLRRKPLVVPGGLFLYSTIATTNSLSSLSVLQLTDLGRILKNKARRNRWGKFFVLHLFLLRRKLS